MRHGVELGLLLLSAAQQFSRDTAGERGGGYTDAGTAGGGCGHERRRLHDG